MINDFQKLERRELQRKKKQKHKIHNKGLANWYDNIVKKGKPKNGNLPSDECK